jgi:cytochrome c
VIDNVTIKVRFTKLHRYRTSAPAVYSSQMKPARRRRSGIAAVSNATGVAMHLQRFNIGSREFAGIRTQQRELRMHRHEVAAIAMALSISAFVFPMRSHPATADEAQALSEQAAAYLQKNGEEKAFADFTRPDGGFVHGELYVFCYDSEGNNKAHGGNPSFVGKNLLHIKDTDGKEPNAEIVKVGFAQGHGWVDFKWPNPATKKIQAKSAYVIHTNNVVCGVGFYK